VGAFLDWLFAPIDPEEEGHAVDQAPYWCTACGTAYYEGRDGLWYASCDCECVEEAGEAAETIDPFYCRTCGVDYYQAEDGLWYPACSCDD